MSYKGKKILAVIPARGGSKSIPHKNLRKINGVSLVGLAVSIAKMTGWIDSIIVSTDSKEIADEAEIYGAEVPFIRPYELASDLAKSIDMWIHAWLETEKIFNEKYDISILLEPTSPLRRVEDIQRTVDKVIDEGFPASATFSKNPAHFTPHKTLIVNNGVIEFYHAEGDKYSIRQNIPDYYHRNGICYAVTKKQLIEKRKIIEENCAAVIIDRVVVNIDEEYELKLAELLLS